MTRHWPPYEMMESALGIDEGAGAPRQAGAALVVARAEQHLGRTRGARPGSSPSTARRGCPPTRRSRRSRILSITPMGARSWRRGPSRPISPSTHRRRPRPICQRLRKRTTRRATSMCCAITCARSASRCRTPRRHRAASGLTVDPRYAVVGARKLIGLQLLTVVERASPSSAGSSSRSSSRCWRSYALLREGATARRATSALGVMYLPAAVAGGLHRRSRPRASSAFPAALDRHAGERRHEPCTITSATSASIRGAYGRVHHQAAGRHRHAPRCSPPPRTATATAAATRCADPQPRGGLRPQDPRLHPPARRHRYAPRVAPHRAQGVEARRRRRRPRAGVAAYSRPSLALDRHRRRRRDRP